MSEREQIELAVKCGTVAENPERYGEENSAKALKLRTEWVSLQTRPLNFKEKQSQEAQLLTLESRMSEFIAGVW